jgi:class 3 adenylate cyclase
VNIALSPLHLIRSSFRWKLLAALLGSISLLTAVTLIVVRSETDRQIEQVMTNAEQRSAEAFSELEEYTRAQLSQLSTVFTASVQAAAALEAALESGDHDALVNDVNYEFELRRIPHSLVAFTDAYGEPVLTMLNRAPLPGPDPAGVLALAERVLYDGYDEVFGYVVVDGALFSVETLLVDLGRPIGTVTIGLPITDDDATRLASVVGAEICFVVEGRCVAGSRGARDGIDSVLAAAARPGRRGDARAGGERWRIAADRVAGADVVSGGDVIAAADVAAGGNVGAPYDVAGPVEPEAAELDDAGRPLDGAAPGPQAGGASTPAATTLPGSSATGHALAATDVWRVIAVPLDAVVAPFERVQRALALGALAALLLAVFVATLLSRNLTRPVKALVSATSRIGAGDYSARVDVVTDDELGTLAASFNDMAAGLALKERYRGVLDKVVSRDVADELLKGDVVLGGEKRVVTIIFGDIVNFTGMTDGMEPTRVISLLNECMERLTAAVEAEGGVVDKYVGDEIMALFGAPVGRPDDELRAIRAALGMQRAMGELNEARALRGEPPLQLSVGMNTGVCMAGNMGSANRLNYTVLGDAVNMAARIEALAAGGQVLMTEHTLRHVQDRVLVRDEGLRELRGFAHPVRVYEVLSVTGASAAAPASTRQPAPEHADDAAPEPEIAPGHSSGTLSDAATRASTLIAAPLAGALAAGAVAAGALLCSTVPLHAQLTGELPTLERVHYVSAGGAFEVGMSGRLDLEGFLPNAEPAWIIPDTKAFAAPRLRLFADAFYGEHVLGTAELRVDRGEEPRADGLEARIDQFFVRLIATESFAVQAGKFVSPFGGWAQRHHTADDPFIRPPLPYDHRTVLNAGHAPPSPEGLLGWKDAPHMWRPTGAPVIWGAPYQWGGMLLGRAGILDWRVAAMNSAPSSEPEEWGLERGFDAPSYVASAAFQPHPALRLGASLSVGPWLQGGATGLPAGANASDYDQRIWGVEAVWRSGRNRLRGELLHDTWRVPNVGYDVVDVSWYVEGERVVTPGLSVAARVGAIRFQGLADTGTTYDRGAPWDHDVQRIQAAVGYRIARNAGVRGEVLSNHGAGGGARLASFQLWWEF